MDDEIKISIADRVTKAHEDELSRLWIELISNENGRRLLHSILEKCQMMNFGHFDSGYDVLLKGRQQVGAEILGDFVFPNGMQFYTDMLLEAEVRLKNLEVAIEAAITKEQDEDMTT